MPVAGRRASGQGPARRRRPGRGGHGSRATTILSWIGVIGALAVFAFVVGGVGSENGGSSPTPGPSSGPLPIAFGTGLDPTTHLITGPTDSFSPGDTFAYSVDPPLPPGVPNVYIAIARIEGGGETEVQAPVAQPLRPGAASFGFAVEATPLIAAWGEGRYVMRIYLDPFAEVYAQGRFVLVEPIQPE